MIHGCLSCFTASRYTVSHCPALMSPLPDRIVLVGLLATIGLCFALAFWSVKLSPRQEPSLQWRDGTPPTRIQGGPQAPQLL